MRGRKEGKRKRDLLLKYSLYRSARGGAPTLNRRECRKQGARRPSETRISHTSDRKSISSQRAHFPYCRVQRCRRDARRLRQNGAACCFAARRRIKNSARDSASLNCALLFIAFHRYRSPNIDIPVTARKEYRSPAILSGERKFPFPLPAQERE